MCQLSASRLLLTGGIVGDVETLDLWQADVTRGDSASGAGAACTGFIQLACSESQLRTAHAGHAIVGDM
jgi:hypothetical protein